MNDEQKYVLIKRGLYWMPKGNGYTGVKAKAGRYSFDDASKRETPDTIKMLLEDAPEFSPEACSGEVIQHQKTTIAAITAERDMLREALVKAQSPQWFYTADDMEIAHFDTSEVIDCLDLGLGKQIVEIATARQLPSIWSVVHVLSDVEKDKLQTDKDWIETQFDNEADAREALAKLEQTND